MGGAAGGGGELLSTQSVVRRGKKLKFPLLQLSALGLDRDPHTCIVEPTSLSAQQRQWIEFLICGAKPDLGGAVAK